MYTFCKHNHLENYYQNHLHVTAFIILKLWTQPLNKLDYSRHFVCKDYRYVSNYSNQQHCKLQLNIIIEIVENIYHNKSQVSSNKKDWL